MLNVYQRTTSCLRIEAQPPVDLDFNSQCLKQIDSTECLLDFTRLYKLELMYRSIKIWLELLRYTN